MAKFYSVGVGAGDGSYITLGALRALEQADIIAVPARNLIRIKKKFQNLNFA